MKILGRDERNKKLIVEMTEDEFGNFAGFSCAYYLKDRGGIEIEVGLEVNNVGKVFTEAEIALSEHKHAISAAKQLKASSTRFLNFFKDMPEK